MSQESIVAGYCPDPSWCIKMGGCMSNCTSGPSKVMELAGVTLVADTELKPDTEFDAAQEAGVVESALV